MKKNKENRSRRITFRLSGDEEKFLDEFSNSVGISRSNLLRNLIQKIQGDVSIIKTDQLLKELAALSAEQGRVNNNINQLAKHANQSFMASEIDPKVYAQFNILLSRYLEYQDKMNRTLKWIYKTIS